MILNTDILGIIIAFAAIFLLARILGKYMSAVYKNEGNLLDFLNPLERKIFLFIGVDPDSEFTWKQNLLAEYFSMN